MLDEKEKSVLNYINSNSVSGTYALFNVEDVKNSLDISAVDAEILKAFYALERLEYVKIKYDDGARLCVMSTARGRNYVSGVERAESALNLAKTELVAAKGEIVKAADTAKNGFEELANFKRESEAKLKDFSMRNLGFTVAFSFTGGFIGAIFAAAVIYLLIG